MTHDDRFRAYNNSTYDALARLAEGAADARDALYQFMCECAIVDCHESVRLTLAQYRDARAIDGRRLIAPGHLVLGDPPSPVEQYDGYWIVRA